MDLQVFCGKVIIAGMRQITILLLMTIVSHASFSQSRIQILAELGVNSGFTIIRKENNGLDKKYEKTEGLLSPVVGAWIGLYQSKHLYINCGMQFNWTGYKLTEERQSYDYLNSRMYNTREVNKLTVYKLSFPITFGYQGYIRKLKIRGFVGYKFVHYESGRYEIDNAGPDYHYTKSFNPFNNPDLELQADKSASEYTSGVGVFINPKIEVITSFSAGGYILFIEKNGTSPSSNGYQHRYSSADLSVTIRYLMGRVSEKSKNGTQQAGTL